MSEKRPQDRADSALSKTREAAELAEYLQERDEFPEDWTPIMEAVIELIDSAHHECLEIHGELNE